VDHTFGCWYHVEVGYVLRINFCLDGSSLCLHASSTVYQRLKTWCALAQFGYTGCTGTNLPYLGRVYLRLNYVDITKCTHIQSWNNDELSFTFTFIDYNQCNLTCMCYLPICMLTCIYYQLFAYKVEVIHLYHSTVHYPIFCTLWIEKNLSLLPYVQLVGNKCQLQCLSRGIYSSNLNFVCLLVQDAPNFLIFRKNLDDNEKGVNMFERSLLCIEEFFVHIDNFCKQIHFTVCNTISARPLVL
jgi:hypothetical protein